ncbi:MAG TPA: TraR/DksA C4-type zinc finger protein [Pseudonocardiaceae bacterium]|nr:TraR/DksA C4-type zinc finger protein [Pseudonocardiaceae bacterium]
MDEPSAIAEARADTERLVESLTRQWAAIVDASELTTNDDEHDPEGATIAFERAQVQAMLAQARADLADLDIAAERVRTGRYRVCEQCGGPIADERLTARPAARTCIVCANRSGRVRR